jgi:hypothetical protein
MAGQPEGDGRLQGELQEAPGHRAPREIHRQPFDAVLIAEVDHRRDHRGVPGDRRRVGEEELAVAVEDAQAPRGRDEQSGAREENPHQMGGELAFRAGEARCDQRDHQGRGEHAEHHQHRHGQREDGEEGPRHVRGRFVLTARAQPGVDGDERRRQRAFPEQVLQQVGNAERDLERVRRLGPLAEVVGEEDRPRDAREAAQENAGADRFCRHGRIRAAESARRWSRPATRTTP